jgi:ABC-type lipoprotein export system ATPase subunit
MPHGEVVVSLRDVVKNYGGLRPLRIRHFELRQHESVALLGFDGAAAQALVHLITAATIPDSGQVEVFGSPTKNIVNADSWLQFLEIFGIVSDRVVLLEELSAEQNIALPLSFEVMEMSAEVRARVAALGDEVGMLPDDIGRSIANLGPAARQRVRLAKALALNPATVLAEHPNAALSGDEVPLFAADFRRVVSTRRVAALLLTADAVFARAAAGSVLSLHPATGELKRAGWRRWL